MTRIGNTKTTTSNFFLLAIVFSTIFQIRPLLFSGIVGDVVSIQQRQLSKELESNIPSIIKTKESNNTDYYIISDQSNIHNNDLSPRTTNTTTTEGPIFYNAYVPIGESKTNNAIKIIKEQLNERSKTSYGSSIIYTLIGNKHVDPIIQQECQPNCTQRAYLPSGDEVDTLQGLWEHCQDHPTDIVTYIHDKGSFHPSGSNSAARRVGTKAALTCRGLLLDHHLPQIETDENETDDSGEETQQILSNAIYSTDVGTELLFENSYSRVWDFYLEPNGGDPKIPHHHVLDYVFVYVAKGRLLGYTHDGRPGLFDSINDDGDVTWFDIEDGAEKDPTRAHGGKNGYPDIPMREYLVELK